MLILLIESSTNICSVALSRDGQLVSIREINEPNRHAELLTVFIDEVMKESGCVFTQLDAVAVSEGPGSYTGLRIGVSAAKGISYALQKPLIAIGTLDAMANGMMKDAQENDLLIPMIDARRMEVYAAIYDCKGNILKKVSPMILDEKSFSKLPVTSYQLPISNLFFSGDGMPKAKELLSNLPNAIFTEAGNCSAKNLMTLAEKKFSQNDFVNVAWFEPFYLKTFHPGPQRSQE